jgi:alpha-1,3-rhamnosyl/mannosyltransferase
MWSKTQLLASWLRPQYVALTVRWLWSAFRRARGRSREHRLTVAIEAAPLWEPLVGIGWYLYILLRHLADRDDLRIRLYPPQLLPPGQRQQDPVVPLPEGPALEFVEYGVPAALEPFLRLARPLLRLATPALIAADRNDLRFAPNYYLPRRFRFAGGRFVATVHDLALYRCPETMAPETVALLRRHLPSVLATADRLITDSSTVRAELVAEGLAAADRVDAVPLGPGQLGEVVAGDLPAGLEPGYALHVGTIEPRKNLAVLLAAWRRLRAAGDAPILVLCGRVGWRSETIIGPLEEAESEGWLKRLGYADSPRLKALYEGAAVVVMPSIYEGFGLPAVEAMAAGAPLVLSDLPVLREVAGDAAVFAAADDSAAWATEIRKLLDDRALRDRLVAAGRRRLQRFDWQRTADATTDVWRRAVLRGE